MICDRILKGSEAQTLAVEAMPLGPQLDDATWVQRIEVWFTEDLEGVDFTEFRVFDHQARQKTIRIPGY